MSKKEIKQSFYNVVTSDVLDDKRLELGEIVLFVRISGLTVKNGFCYASDEFFAKKLQKSIRTVQRWLARLEDFGYIQRVPQYYPNSKKIKCRYINISRPLFSGDTHDTTNGDTGGDTSGDTHGVENNKRMSSVFITEVINRDFEKYKDFLSLILDWVEYKKTEKKQSYKTEKGLKAFVNRLIKISSGNLEKAKEIVETSMANNWSGIFAPNSKPKDNEKRNSGGFTSGSQLYGGQ